MFIGGTVSMLAVKLYKEGQFMKHFAVALR